MINLHERKLPTSAGIEPATSWSLYACTDWYPVISARIQRRVLSSIHRLYPMNSTWAVLVLQTGTLIKYALPYMKCKKIVFGMYATHMSDWLNYSWLSLSRTRLSRITVYLEAIIWSLLKHENLLTGNKILWKRGEIAPFSSFPQYFQYISNFRSQITYTFVKCCWSIHFFLNSANLICRYTDILKYFRESLGIWDNQRRIQLYYLRPWDNESRLYCSTMM